MRYSTAIRDEFIVRSRFQRDWIEGRALWLLAAIYLGGLGEVCILYRSWLIGNWDY